MSAQLAAHNDKGALLTRRYAGVGERQMNRVQVLFTKHENIGSWAIRAMTMSPWSHVAVPYGFDINQAHRYRYDGSQIVPRTATSYGRIITRLAFLIRFTDAEAIAIDLASIGGTVEAATLRRAQAKINAAEEIQLDNAETRAGVQALETAGLIATGRATAILDATVQAHEVPARYRALYYLPEVPA